MEKFKLFRYSLLAGLMIAIGGTVNLSVENKVVGAFLFSIGLFTVVNQQFALFTGRVGDFKLKQPAFLIDLLIIWMGNFAATVGVGYLLRVTRVASTLSAKAETLSQAKLNDNPLSIFVLAIFCGIIMYVAVACFRSTENPIGKYIRMGQEMFRVIGTIKNTMLNSYEARVIYMPYSVYEQVDATAGRFGTVVFSTVKGAKIKEVNTHVRNVMARKYQFAPSDDKVFYFNSMEEQVKAFTDLFVMIRKFLWFMGISTLVSGVIGVGNIMYSSAKERTREIGIRKSVGAKAQQIKAMFLWESIALTSLAGYVGLVLGWGILKVVALFISEDTPMMEKPGLDFPTAVAAIFILVIAGTLAGLRPAIYAAELNPIEALKEEN